jgi:hypothetical protein
MTSTTQSAPCAISPRDKQQQAKLVGDDLIKHHGKRKFYSVQQVRDANERCNIPIDYACWSHSLFNTHFDFDRIHSGIGEACDYLAMKKEMLTSISISDSSSWFDFDLSWLEFPDIDWSIFDIFDL